jgi:hypothetical protein
MPDLAVEYLAQCFDADFETGQLRWRVRPREHFLFNHAWNKANAQHAGKPAGSLTNHGYVLVHISIQGKPQRMLAHRIVWALAHGRWPPQQIDHHDGNRSNNSLANLRDATHSENQHNRHISKHNISGFLGVAPGSKYNKHKWRAQIKVHGEKYHLGWFNDRQSAFNAYLAAKARLHPFQPVPRQ